MLPSQVLALTPTTTSLNLNPPPPVNAGEVVTLTALVTNGSSPVSFGTVTFLSGTVVLGTVQLKLSDGTATLKTRFAPGSNTLTARYDGTTTFQTSTSSPQVLTVNGTESTIGTLNAVPNGGDYDFTLQVFGFGFAAVNPPTGTASLDELQNPPLHLGDFALSGPGVLAAQTQQTYPVGVNPFVVQLADVNGDGILDAIVTSSADKIVSVLLGVTDGTFQPQTKFTVGTNPNGVAVGDFNGDGIPDLAVVNSGSNSVGVMLGKGDGTFLAQQEVAVGTNPYAPVVGDFNGDGIADLAVTNQATDNLTVLLGNGDATFAQPITVNVGNFPRGIVTSDFNHDGIADLGVVNSNAATIGVLLGNGDGTFQAMKTYAVGNSPRRIVAADFNGDGNPDLAITNNSNNNISVLLGNANGTFQAQTTFPVGNGPIDIVTADFDGDQKADLAVTNSVDKTVGVLLGNGNGSFQAQKTFPAGLNTRGIAQGDVNGDGVPDIVTSNLNEADISVLILGSSTTDTLIGVQVIGQGQQTVQSTYAPDTQFYTGGASNSLVLAGTLVDTGTSVSADIDPSQYLQPVKFTAKVGAANGGTPTGKVDFIGDAGLLCSVQLVPAPVGSEASCQVALDKVGVQTIFANYLGDNNYSPSSGNAPHDVQPAGTSVSLVADPPNQQFFGQPVKLAATVTGAFGGLPTGTVDFVEAIRQLSLCVGVPLVSGSASCTTTALPPGTVSLVVTYNGDANYLPSSQNISNYQIVAGPSATALTVAPQSPTAGEVVTLTAAVTSGSTPVTVGTVTFLSGTVVLGTVQLKQSDGVATLKTRFAPGSDTLTARYDGTNGFQTSTSSPQALTVSGTESTISTLSAVPNGSNYDFTLNVLGWGFAATHPPTGNASLDQTSQQIHLGDFHLAGGAPTFSARGPFAVGKLPRGGLAAGDFNGDGCPDLVVGNQQDNTVSVLLGNCDGTFQAQVTYPVDLVPEAIAVGDFNRDGVLDLAVACHNSDAVDVLFGNADGSFQAGTPYPANTAISVAVGDFNGDGVLDLVSASSQGQAGAGALMNNGDGSFTPFPTTFVGPLPTAIAVGDFNSDGNLDMAVTSAGASFGSVAVLLGDGQGTFPNTSFVPVGMNPQAIVAGDLNGDTCLDLAAANFDDNTVSVLLGGVTNGHCNGTFPTSKTLVGFSSPQGLAIADFNGDGIPDLAVTNSGNNTVAVMLGKGDGSFQQGPQFSVGRNPIQIAVADFDGNAVPDIAVGNVLDNNVGAYLGGAITTDTISNVFVIGKDDQTIQSTYAPDTQFYTGGKSNVLVLAGQGVATGTVVSADIDPSQYLQPVTFTALVGAADGGDPTGEVDFVGNGHLLCASQLVPGPLGNQATCTVAFDQVGLFQAIVASYLGDSNYFGSDSSPIGHTVEPAATSFTLAADPPNQQTAGLPVKLTATMSGAFGGLPTGTVDFKESLRGLNLCLAVPLVGGSASCTTTALPPGTSILVGIYGGDGNYLGSSQSIPNYQIVLAPSATTLSVAPQSPVVSGQVVTLTASVTSGNQPVSAGTVTFSNGTQVLGVVQMNTSTGNAVLKTRFGPGSYNLVARYNGVTNIGTSTSTPQGLIATGTEPTTSALTATPNGDNYDFGLQVFAYGFVPPTGTASLDQTVNSIHLGDFSVSTPARQLLTQSTSYAVGTQPNFLATGDFNQDGYADVVVSVAGDNALVVFLGSADGTLVPQTPIDVGSRPAEVVVGDFNGDGNLDVAVALPSVFAVDVLFGKGDGTFQTPQVIASSVGGALLVTGDFNGDGWPDLADASVNGFAEVMLNDEAGNFKVTSDFIPDVALFDMTLGDFNGDGILDIAFTAQLDDQVLIALGKGDGTFVMESQQYAVGKQPGGIAAGDFNGDHLDDLAVANRGDNTISILIANGNGTFQPQQTYSYASDAPYDVAVTNINGDGIPDLVVSYPTNGLILTYAGNGDGTFQPGQLQYGAQNNRYLAVADLNGDGVPDLLSTLDTSNALGVQFGGTSTQSTLTNIPVPGKGQVTVQSTYAPNVPYYTGSVAMTLVNGSAQATITTLSADFPNAHYPTIGISQTVTFTAIVTANGGAPTGTVTFSADGSNLCSGVALQQRQGAAIAACQYAFPSIGNHTVIATYSGDSLYSGSTSNQIIEPVSKVNDYVVTLAVASPDQGASIVLSATVEPPQNCVNPCPGKAQLTPTGTVNFQTDTHVDLGTRPLDATATATLTLSNAGNFTAIYAYYSGDDNFAPAVSNPQNSIAPPIVVTEQTTTQGATVPTPITLTVQFPEGNVYYKVVTCSAPVALGITCIPNPALITGDATKANVDIKTTATVGYLPPGPHFGARGDRVLAALSIAGSLGLVCLVMIPGTKRRGVSLLLLVCAAAAITSCGGITPGVPPGGTTIGTPPGQYQITGYATLYRKTGEGTNSSVQVGTPQYFLIHLLVK